MKQIANMLYTWSSAAYFEAQTDSLCILLAKSCEKPLISKSNFYWTSLFLIWIYRCIIITLILIKSSKGIQIYSMKCIQTKLFMHPLQSKSWLVLVAGAMGVGGLLWHRCKKSTVNLFIMFLAMLMHIIVASGSVFGGLPFQNNYSVKIMKYSYQNKRNPNM